MKRRTGCVRSIHFEPWVTFEYTKTVLGYMGRNWRQGYFEWDGSHFYWTPKGKEQCETTAADFL